MIFPQLGDSEAAATAPEEEKHETAAGPVRQPMEGGLPSDDEEVLLPYGEELKSSESTVLPVHYQALLVQHQASPQAKSTRGQGGGAERFLTAAVQDLDRNHGSSSFPSTDRGPAAMLTTKSL